MGLRWRDLARATIAQFIVLCFVSQLALTGAVLFFVHQSTEATLLNEQKALVSELRDDLVAGYREGGERQLVNLIETRLSTLKSEVPVILLVRGDGTYLTGNLGAWPTVIPKSTEWQTTTLYRTGSDIPEPMGIIATPLPGGDYLLTGHVIDSSIRLKDVNQEAMLGAFLLTLPLAFLLALLLGRMINARVRSIAATAEAVGAGDLSHRVMRSGSGDSFDALAHGINSMLDRIEGLVSELRIVTDGLAHDLRSPITRLKSTLERAMIETRDPAALGALEKVSAEAEALLVMLTTALQISRAEAGIGRERFSETDVAQLLTDLVEVYGPVAEEHGITLSCKAPTGLVVPMHRDLLSQALGNLIENALKYGQGATTIDLSAATTIDTVSLIVADNGPGIPVERRAEAMKKFSRLDPARNVPGSGLGLSLVEAVAKLHGGRIDLDDNAPGLRVRLTIKRQP